MYTGTNREGRTPSRPLRLSGSLGRCLAPEYRAVCDIVDIHVSDARMLLSSFMEFSSLVFIVVGLFDAVLLRPVTVTLTATGGSNGRLRQK